MIRKLLRLAVYALLAILPGRQGNEAAVARSAPGLTKSGSLKRWLGTAAALLAIFAIGGFLLVISGIIPIKASSRHWAITQWFLNFAKERSVSTHSMSIRAPDLDSPLLQLKGATHYETGCAPCHGSPGMRQPRVPHAMTPSPPPLQQIRTKFDEGELFYIVKHGIKFTGMPAWPAPDRDDEVWAMVAFLRALPNIDQREYQRLARGTVAKGKAEPLHDMAIPGPIERIVRDSCSRCHGADGMGRGLGAAPRLAGQKPAYILGSLHAYASGRRSSGIMGVVAHALNEDHMEQLSVYYSQLPAEHQPAKDAEESAIERGRKIAGNGVPQQRVPACTECHGPGSSKRRNEMYPRLSGQYADYLMLQLELFKQRKRGGTEYSHLMHLVADRLTSQQMHEVAQYFASLPVNEGEQLSGR